MKRDFIASSTCEIEFLFLALGTGYFIFTLFSISIFLIYVPHTKLLDIIKIFLFGNKNNIIIKFFKIKLLIIVIFSRIFYFFLLKCVSILYLPWWTPTYFTAFAMVFDYIFGFIILETGICVMLYMIYEYFGVESHILDYSFYPKFKKDFNARFSALSSNNVVNTMHHYGSAVKHNKVFGSTMHRADGWSSNSKRPKLSIKVNSDWYVKSDYYYEFKSYFSSHKKSDGALSDTPRFWRILNLYQNHLKSVSNYNKEVWLQTGKINYEILNVISGSKDPAINQLLTLLINQAFVLKYNNDGTFPVLKADLGWVNYTIQKLGSAFKSPDFHFYVANSSELFEFFDMFASVISSKGFDLSNFSNSRVINNYFSLPADKRAAVLTNFAKQIDIACVQQEQQLVINDAVGFQCNYPISLYFGESLARYHSSLRLALDGGNLGKPQSGFGDLIIILDNVRILLELKNRGDFHIFSGNIPHFLDEVDIGTVKGATFFETLFSSNFPKNELLKFGEQFGCLCRENDCENFSICVTNIRNIGPWNLKQIALQDGITYITKNNRSILYQISEENRIKRKWDDISFYNSSQKLELELYTRNFLEFNKGLDKYGVSLSRMLATRVLEPSFVPSNSDIIKKLTTY